jgi:transcriptional regulator with PAS, ATPase and Fis domain
VLQLRPADLADWARRRERETLATFRRNGDRLFLRVEPGRNARRLFVPAARSAETPLDALARLDGGDPNFKAAIAKARRVIGKPIPLLLQGESGSGKELFAQAFHDAGPRRSQPFVAVNCATLPENLIEAELFGYVAGAFSGARKEGNPGRIRAAHGGTLFLDEIGDMPLSQQARLLRVLEAREVVPVGACDAVAVDFMLVCASHRNLKMDMEAGRFRADLYYRINGLTLSLPALRERGDQEALIAKILHETAPGRQLVLDAEVAAAFAHYAWPGNLRQLANALRTACALIGDDETSIRWEHLPDDLMADLLRPARQFHSAAVERSSTDNLRAVSAAAISRAIHASAGNMSEAARRLGISRNTLYRRIKSDSR